MEKVQIKLEMSSLVVAMLRFVATVRNNKYCPRFNSPGQSMGWTVRGRGRGNTCRKKKSTIFQFATSYLGLRLIQMIQGGPRGEKSGA